MQTVASLAERLDMTAQEALEKLRFMMMDVESVDSVLTDDQCDLLIDVDDDPTVAERVRQKRLDDEEKARKRTERLKAAAQKAAAKRKAESEKKAATKKKSVAKKKTSAKKAPAKKTAAKGTDAETAEELPKVEILPPESKETETSAAAVEDKKKPAVKAEKKQGAKVKKESDIQIGRAVDHEESVQIIRADGTRVKELDIELGEQQEALEEEAELAEGILAEAERHQEEEEARKAREAARCKSSDPAVVRK